MFQNTPGPPITTKRSKKSPRRVPGSDSSSNATISRHPPPHNMQSYLNDIANRKGSFSLMKMRKHPITMTNIILPPSFPDNEFDNRNTGRDDYDHDYDDSDNDDDNDIGYNGYDDDDYDNRAYGDDSNNMYGPTPTARVLFERNPTMKVTNEVTPNRFREFDGSPPAFKGPNNIVMEHILTKRGRSAHFVIREHSEDEETLFSVHVHGKKQRYSFHVPSSQELRVLLQLWDRHPPSRNFRCIAQNIIKSTSISFTGQHIDSILFKDQGFSLKIKREAIKLLSNMAIIIQKNVRRYLVLLTSLHHANKVALSFRPPQQQEQWSPARHNHTTSSSTVINNKNHKHHSSKLSPSPTKVSPSSLGWQSSTGQPQPPHAHNDNDNDNLLIEDAIRAQALAEAENSAKHAANIKKGENVFDIHDCNSDNKEKDEETDKDSIVRFSDRPNGMTHAEKVAELLDERNRAEVRARAETLSKKKQKREQTKALQIAEKKQEIINNEKAKENTVGSAMRVLHVAVKLKGKAVHAQHVVEEAALAEAKALEEEEAAKIKALQNKALSRGMSELNSAPPNPTFKEFHMKKAQEEKAKLQASSDGNKEIHYSSSPSSPMEEEVDDVQVTQTTTHMTEPEDIGMDLKGLDDVNNNVTEGMTAGDLFRAKLEQNKWKERQIGRRGGGGGRSEEKGGNAQARRVQERHVMAAAGGAAGGGESGGGSDMQSVLNQPPQHVTAALVAATVSDKPMRKLKKFDDKLPAHLFDKYFDSLKEKEQQSVPKEEILAVFGQMESDAFFNQPSVHAVESDAKLMSWIDVLFLSLLKYKDSTDVVLAGLKIAAMFPFDKLAIPDHRVGFCGIIGKVLSPHVDCEDYCAEVLHCGAKFTSKKRVQNLEQAVDNEGLEIILKVLLKYGQNRDVIGNAPKVVVTCLKYLRNICLASSEHIQSRLMAAGVGSCLVKLLVFYRTDESVVAAVCRTVATLVKNTSHLMNFSSPECLHLYMLILKTNPMNKTIAKAVGVLLIEIYNVDPQATKEVFLKVDFANLLNNLLLAQKDLSSRFSLSVIECNIMMTSFFVIQVAYLKPEFLRLDVVTTLQQYQQNQQNFGNNIDVVIHKCLKHLTSSSSAADHTK